MVVLQDKTQEQWSGIMGQDEGKKGRGKEGGGGEERREREREKTLVGYKHIIPSSKRDW